VTFAATEVRTALRGRVRQPVAPALRPRALAAAEVEARRFD
jgi:hypothetical protein